MFQLTTKSFLTNISNKSLCKKNSTVTFFFWNFLFFQILKFFFALFIVDKLILKFD